MKKSLLIWLIVVIATIVADQVVRLMVLKEGVRDTLTLLRSGDIS